ncbi:MAG: hypothetical protein AB1673_03690 [Actinomycetota bacterium]
MDAAQLRPLSIGEVLDLAIKIYRQRFVHLVKAVAVVVAPVAVVSALVQVSTFPDFAAFSTTPETVPEFGIADFWAFLAGILVVALLGFLSSQIATAASFMIVSGAYLDQRPDWRASLAYAWSRLRSLAWLAVVTGVLLMLAFLALVIPGVYLYGAWVVAVPVLLLEDLRGTKALRRSHELVKGRWWPTAVAVVVSVILAAMVQSVFGGVLSGVIIAGGGSVAVAAAQAVATTAGSVLTTPFTAAVITVVYFDLRVRKEGFDLELLARRVGVEPPPGGFPAPSPPPGPPTVDEPPPFWPPPPGWGGSGRATGGP